MWKKLRLLLILLLLLAIVSPFVLVFLAIEDEPLLAAVPELSSDDVRRARELIDRSDPRSLAEGETATLELSDRDVNLMLAYVTSRLGYGVSRVAFVDGAADVEISVELPDNPLGRYLNLTSRVATDGQRALTLRSLRIGKVPVPGWIAARAGRRAEALLRRDDRLDAAWDALDAVEIRPTQAVVRYRWQRELAADVVQAGRDTFNPNLDTELIAVYFDEARTFGTGFDDSDEVSLARLVGPIFALAAERTAAGGDAVAENRAAVIGMSVYALKVNPDLVLDVDATAPDLRNRPSFTLRDRNDFAKHFLMSATLNAAAGSVLADAVGLEKEVLDSQGGSGFSFTDLAADRAGVRFLDRALESAAAAAGLQTLLAGSAEEDAFMPVVGDLPEGMPEAEFLRRFEGVGSEPYRRLVAEIEQRIDALPIYR